MIAVIFITTTEMLVILLNRILFLECILIILFYIDLMRSFRIFYIKPKVFAFSILFISIFQIV